MTLSWQLTLIFAVGVAAWLGCMCAAFYAFRRRDDLDSATEARIWERVKAAIEDEK